MDLSFLETELNSTFDLNLVNDNLNKGLKNLISNNKEEIVIDFLNDKQFKLEFTGITLFIFNANKRKVFYRTKLNIIDISTGQDFAWYEQEYDSSHMLIDDYFDHYP